MVVHHWRKSLLGLEHSAHNWNGTFKDFVISIGFVASTIDGAVHVLHDNEAYGIVGAAVLLFIDGLLIIADEDLIGRIKDQMKKRFCMHDHRSVSCYVGMNIEHNQEHHMINIHQHSYIQTFLAKFRMD